MQCFGIAVLLSKYAAGLPPFIMTRLLRIQPSKEFPSECYSHAGFVKSNLLK